MLAPFKSMVSRNTSVLISTVCVEGPTLAGKMAVGATALSGKLGNEDVLVCGKLGALEVLETLVGVVLTGWLGACHC